MTKVMRQAFTEVNEILKYLPEKYVNKVPIKIRKAFYHCRIEDYPVNVDINRPLYEQHFVYETGVILVFLKLNYWCESEEEKNALMQQLKENETKLKEQYDITKLHERTKEDTLNQLNNGNASGKSTHNMENALPLNAKKHSWFSKIINKIKSIFTRKNEVVK